MTGAVTPPIANRFTAWMTVILLLAALLRLFSLTGAPPGMTHDEADHGITAQAIIDGARDIYFTIGYGREPLYDYATAGVMAGIGETIFSARLTAAFFSLILVVGMAVWVRAAFGAPAALLTAAGLAAGFWPVMAGRQALRSIVLPALFVLAVYLFWRALVLYRRQTSTPGGVASWHVPALLVAGGALLGLTFYSYIPARILWLIFPALVVYLMLVRRDWLAGVWARLALFLGVAAVVAAPLALHLLTNPGLEVRISELSAPLTQAAAGDFTLLRDNILGSLRLFTIEGDPTWRYNLPGRPWLAPLTGLLFYAGLLWAGWLALRGVWRRPAHPDQEAGAFLALVWLLVGLSPVLVTGPELSMTQAIGLLPVLYLFPALALVAIYGVAARLWSQQGWSPGVMRAGATLLAIALVAWGVASTARDYFDRWANSPEVRVQYEATMLEIMAYLNAQGNGPTAISTITPGRFHTPAVAQLALDNPGVEPRYFDARQSWLVPAGGGEIVVPGFTPLPEALQTMTAMADKVTELSMRPADLDRPVTVYAVDEAEAWASWAGRAEMAIDDGRLPISFGQTADLLGYLTLPPVAQPGDELAVITAWSLRQPLEGAMLFAQLIGPQGLVAQSDQLGAPGESWQRGDTLWQLHPLVIPPGTPPGEYALITGIYTQPDGLRLTAAVDGESRDAVTLSRIRVADE